MSDHRREPIMKPLTRIDPDFSTSSQIAIEDLADFKAAGFRSVICNRPDNEDGNAHPDHHRIESEAKRLGLEFAYLPVAPGQMNDGHVAEFKAIMSSLPRPAVGYCKMGIRSKILYERSR